MIELLAIVFLGRTKADIAAEAEAETDTGTEIEPGIETETGGDAIALDRARDPGLAPETATEIETEAKEGRSPPAGGSARPAPERIRTGTGTAGKTNTWTGLLQRSLLWGTSTTARSPASCSSDVLSSWRD